MSTPWSLVDVDECANMACPNMASQGRMALAETTTNTVGGHRPLRFILCAPCASALDWPETTTP